MARGRNGPGTGPLTYKQELVIADIAAKVEHGKPMKVLESVEKFYNVKNRTNAHVVMHRNMQKQNFREALISSLVDKKVLGANSKTERVLLEGLEATKPDESVDYDVRLKYVQEINKVAGVYAPEVKKSLNLNMDMSEEELDKRIKELQAQTGVK
jgi:hypothetical protein